MTESEETYVHYLDCIKSLNHARSILLELRTTNQKPTIHAAAFCFALIEYAKPYTRSDGAHKKGRSPYKLTAPDLPEEYLKLHSQILVFRDRVLAHSDLTLKEARIDIGEVAGMRLLTVMSNIPQSLPDRKAVIALIEHTLDKMYVERERLKKALVPRTKTATKPR